VTAAVQDCGALPCALVDVWWCCRLLLPS